MPAPGKWILFAVLSFGLARAADAEVVIVRDGGPASAIVLADAPSSAAKRAARLLNETIAEMSGAKLEVLAEKALGPVELSEGRLVTAAGKPRTLILVGQSGLAAKLGLEAEGFQPGEVQIATRGNGLALLGADDRTPSDPWGTVYAACIFLEDHLGCRFLWPGDSGKVVPKRSTIALGDIQFRYAPPIRQRGIRSSGYSDRIQTGLDKLGFSREQFEQARREQLQPFAADVGWSQWQRVGGSLELRSGHSLGDYWKRFGREHPEWFAMQPNGSRDQSISAGRPRLCKSNPALLEQIARDRIEELNAHPGQKSVSIGPNDGGRTTFCMCPECKKLDPPEGRKLEFMYDDASGPRVERKFFEYVSLTDRMVAFYNAIAERVVKVHPDVLLVADAYSRYSAPPIRAKLHPNVVIRFVPMSYTSETARRQALADWDAWSKAASKIYFRPNCLLAGRRNGVLLVYARRMAEDMHHLASSGLIGTDFDSCAHHWAVHGLNYYVIARLLWNPKLEADQIVADYCTAGFGPSAGPVREYFRQVEALTDRVAQEEGEALERYTPEQIDRLRKLLTAAQEQAAADEAVRRRIEFLRLGLEFTALQARAYALLRADPPPGKPAVRELLERRAAMMRDLFQHHHAAVNVASIVWGEGHPWSKLGWSWEAAGKKGKN